jgi:large subunit ribosomal protein L25
VPEVRIAAEPRTEFGKGAARRIRRAHKVPAVVYGHGTQPRHIALPGHDLMLALKTSNVLIELQLDGGKELVLPKSVQRDAIKGFLEHVDLVVVKRGEKVVVEVPVIVSGTPIEGGVLDLAHNTVSVEAEATNIPAEIQVDVDKQAPGFALHASELDLPADVTLMTEPDTVIVHILAPQAEEEPEAVEGEEGVEGEAVEGGEAPAAAAEPAEG